jgi:AcrR family transcriptional regulator
MNATPPSPHSRTSQIKPSGQPEKSAVILASARDVFLKHGFAAATTDMIQQAAKVSKSTVYAYFPNKEAMFAAVVETECERLLNRIRALPVNEEPFPERLHGVARAYLDVVLSEEGQALYRMIVAEAPRFPELARRFYLAGPGQMNSFLSDILGKASLKRELDLDFAGTDAAAVLLVNMIRGEAQMQCVTHPSSEPSAAQRDQWASLAVRTFLRAFAPSLR